MKEFLEMEERSAAIFAGNDYIALGALKAVEESGLNIPDEDIALVGFDDLKFTSTLKVSLTTIRQSKYEIGEKSAEILIEKIRKQKNRIERVILPVRRSYAIPVE